MSASPHILIVEAPYYTEISVALKEGAERVPPRRERDV